ncbi:MAG: hypothetical protein ACN6OP_12705, partial [Pseudomonadales bacterium]
TITTAGFGYQELSTKTGRHPVLSADVANFGRKLPSVTGSYRPEAARCEWLLLGNSFHGAQQLVEGLIEIGVYFGYQY